MTHVAETLSDSAVLRAEVGEAERLEARATHLRLVEAALALGARELAQPATSKAVGHSASKRDSGHARDRNTQPLTQFAMQRKPLLYWRGGAYAHLD